MAGPPAGLVELGVAQESPPAAFEALAKLLATGAPSWGTPGPAVGHEARRWRGLCLLCPDLLPAARAQGREISLPGVLCPSKGLRKWWPGTRGHSSFSRHRHSASAPVSSPGELPGAAPISSAVLCQLVAATGLVLHGTERNKHPEGHREPQKGSGMVLLTPGGTFS